MCRFKLHQLEVLSSEPSSQSICCFSALKKLKYYSVKLPVTVFTATQTVNLKTRTESQRHVTSLIIRI